MEDDVAFFEGHHVDFLQARLHQKRYPTNHGGAKIGDRNQIALLVGQTAGEVQRFVEDRGVGGLLQGNSHFSTDRYHRRVENTHRYHIHYLPSADFAVTSM
ncbi:hypothetical protein D3C73_1251550 [compost metagenome]